MARNEQIRQDTVNNLTNKASIRTYGMDLSLDTENIEIKNIIQQTITDTKTKFGVRTNGKPINYFNELNFGNAFSEFFVTDKKNKDDSEKIKDVNDFKKYMTNNANVDIGALLMEDGTRKLLFNNYRIIDKHIPECSMARKLYKDNIMSPDDYTKLIFNIDYDKAIDDDTQKIVNERLDAITTKYQLEDKADKIIDEALILGESYYAVLSLEEELNTILNDPIMKKFDVLNESAIRLADKNLNSTTILSENVSINDSELNALNEFFNTNSTLKEAQDAVASMINNNIVIGSVSEMLLERYEADKENNRLTDVPDKFYKENGSKSHKGKKEKFDATPMFLNGSVIRRLEPDKVIELKIDDICYGYWYAEEAGNPIPQSSYLGINSGRDNNGSMNLAQNNTINGVGGSAYTPSNSAAAQLGVSESKLKLISDLFLNVFSKKVNKDFIRKNKQFKDFIYELVRQDYIVKKGLKLTYFKPDEVIKFECDPIYKDITFFAKLYLSILTNNLLIKLGRAHDKRIFYINVGADAAYEQAVQSVIQDVKTKDYKMEQLNDFNTILNLNPGRFDDYFMPTINGERPVEIETLAGMDIDMNNEFVEYLKNSMMSGMGAPRNLIDVTAEVDYARSVSAMNANFVRSICRYQKKFTPPFTRMYQKIYQNEYKFVNNMENKDMSIDISSIRVQFPSPATLVMTNISEQIQAVDANAEFFSAQLVPIKQDGSTEDIRIKLKSKIVKELLPSVDWDKYEELLEEVMRDAEKDKIKAAADPNDPMNNPMMDPSMGGGYGY